MEMSELLAIARGDVPAELLLTNARIVNVYTGEIENADIAIAGSVIAGIGGGYRGKETIDLAGTFVAPGLIDAHVHIESSLCTPPQFARAVVPRGVTTVVTDPHEIANVAGAAGVDYMIQSSRGLPLDVIVMAPSCVPATNMATSGASLSASELSKLRDEHSAVHGLAEVMNYPGVINGDPEVLAKINAFKNRPIDGHAPGVRGPALNAYITAGIGSDHECVSVDEAREKLSRGLYILIREASNARNLHALLPLVNERTNRRICFCTDDRQPADLLGEGSIDHMVREAIKFGVDPVSAFRLATLNTAEWFGLSDRGAIAPGKRADLMVFDDLNAPSAKLVVSQGRIVARHGALTSNVAHNDTSRLAASAPGIDFERIDLKIPSRTNRVKVIGSIEGQLITNSLERDLPSMNGELCADTSQDVLKMVVIERHQRNGKIGRGFIHGFALKRGAIAGTVAHDHHNLVIIGADDESMRTAARATNGAGLSVADGSTIFATLPLPVAGLMSDRLIEEVRDAYAALITAAKSLGATMADPFMAMSFMALEVIPSLKLTDMGLVDVEQFKIVDL